MLLTSLPCALLAPLAPMASAQIGGETAETSDPFALEDAEDLDLVADGVSREWVSDSVFPVGQVLRVLPLANSPELALASEQSPVGSLLAVIPEDGVFIDAGFGVPMPGVKGVSTDVVPGDVTSYSTLSFLMCVEPAIPSLTTDLLLESNVTPSLPRMLWNYAAPTGKTFTRVEIPLRQPDLILDGQGASIEGMLANTRFLFFSFSSGPVAPGTLLSVRIDDIRLEANRTATLAWQLYR